MGWQPELDELRERERLAAELGGADKVKRQHDAGKLTVRERIDGLVDGGSFHEIGVIAGRAQYDSEGRLLQLVPSNCVMGRAAIDGRPVVVVGDDFTVRGGSADATIREKPLMAEQMAHDLKLPLVRIIEGSGGGGSVKTIETTGRANLPGRVGSNLPYYYTTANLGHVPVVALGLGSVAGLGAARMAASHYSVMTKETSALFVAGPPVVNALVKGPGNTLDRFELGGWEIQTRCGAVDHAVDSEEEAFACRRSALFEPPSARSSARPTPAISGRTSTTSTAGTERSTSRPSRSTRTVNWRGPISRHAGAASGSSARCPSDRICGTAALLNRWSLPSLINSNAGAPGTPACVPSRTARNTSGFIRNSGSIRAI
jgi:acetyl-CoA carboxylase carboxyltransferase component